MYEGRTTSGFEFKVDENAINDMRVVDAVAEIADGSDPLAISFLVRKLLGNEQREQLYQHVEENGRVPLEKINDEITEIFKAIGGDGKNS